MVWSLDELWDGVCGGFWMESGMDSVVESGWNMGSILDGIRGGFWVNSVWNLG